jgi:hypothetical protein
MVSWKELEAEAPDLATAGHALLYQYGPGLAYLATVRKDGGPRLHPFCPVIVDGRVHAYIGHSPKLADLVRDGRYALHSFPKRDGDDEFYISGRARRIDDRERRAAVSAAITAQGTTHGADDVLFEFDIDRAMHAAYSHQGPGSWPPAYTIWRRDGGISRR